MTLNPPTTAISIAQTADPFDLEVQIVPEAVTGAGRACTTNDGCAPSCASSCTSSSC